MIVLFTVISKISFVQYFFLFFRTFILKRNYLLKEKEKKIPRWKYDRKYSKHVVVMEEWREV